MILKIDHRLSMVSHQNNDIVKKLLEVQISLLVIDVVTRNFITNGEFVLTSGDSRRLVMHASIESIILTFISIIIK